MRHTPYIKVLPDDLVDLQSEIEKRGLTKRIEVRLVYGDIKDPHNEFKLGDDKNPEPLYRPGAKMWAQKLVAEIILGVPKYLPDDVILEACDILRTVDAQRGMEKVKTDRKLGDHLVSSPGQGQHPVGTAFDLIRKGNKRRFDDFTQLNPDGTVITNLTTEGLPAASRKNPFISEAEKEEQRILEKAVMRSALDLGVLVMPLPDEHWDFRLPNAESSLWHVMESIARIIKVELPVVAEQIDTYEQFIDSWDRHFGNSKGELKKELGVESPPAKAGVKYGLDFLPLCDADLPDHMQMTDGRYRDEAREVVLRKIEAAVQAGANITSSKNFAESIIPGGKRVLG